MQPWALLQNTRKNPCLKNPTNHICDKKYGVFQSDKKFFDEVAEELGLLKKGNAKDLSYYRHPLAYLVEAADDIATPS
jgi:dGTPase